MYNKPWTENEFKLAKECARKSSNSMQMFRLYNKTAVERGWISRSGPAMQTAFRNRGENYGDYLKSYDPAHMNEELKEPLDNLREELKETAAKLEETEKRLGAYSALAKTRPSPPRWLCSTSSKSQTGTPVLFLSDIHYGEYVDAKQIEGCNSYNLKIANDSMHNTIEKAIALAYRFMYKPKYDGIVLAVGGDLLTGNIHDELKETNEAGVLESMSKLRDQFIWAINELHRTFGRVYVPWVVGNHARMSMKPRAKGKVKDNYEWLLGDMLAKHFEREKDIKFDIPESTDVTFPVYQTRFLLSHGDQFRGGSGISGYFSPLFIGQARKHRRQLAINKPFDVMMLGHFHQYIHTEQLLVNGSMIGYNEYAYQMNLPFEKPRQSFFICHPQYGVTYRMPILCRET